MANQAQHDKTKFSVGDTIAVHHSFKEGKKKRTQAFEGIVISIRGRQENKSFTVRKQTAAGVSVERIWPLASPWLKKIEVKKKGKVRRAKLYYLRKSDQKKS